MKILDEYRRFWSGFSLTAAGGAARIVRPAALFEPDAGGRHRVNGAIPLFFRHFAVRATRISQPEIAIETWSGLWKQAIITRFDRRGFSGKS